MKKTLRSILVGALCVTMLVPMAACTPTDNPNGTGDKTYKYNPETRPVALAIGAVEENFNPYFYTSLNDGEIVSLTQVSLITSDEEAKLTCGQNEATVALAYRETVYDENGNQTTNGNAKGSTVYEYVIKNGMQFSDGEPLTITDVLFNLYVYLDPLYSGSATLYSTKIKGLSKYRSQNPLASEDAGDDYQDQFKGQVNTRFNNLLSFDDGVNSIPSTPQIESDLRLVADEFEKELNTDWANIEGTAKSYEKEYTFTEDWEVFYLNEGFIGYQMFDYQIDSINPNKPTRLRKTTEGYDANGKPKGKFLTSIDEGGDQVSLRTTMNSVLEGLTGEARTKAMKEEAIKTIFEDYLIVSGEGDDRVVDFYSGKLSTLLRQWATGGNVRTALLNEIMSDYFNNNLENGELKVKQIEGITTYKTTKSQFGSITAGSELDENETYDVLRIEINGVDPAAKWQFGFTVAPMHYYSGTVDGVNYVQRALDTAKLPEDQAKNVSNRFGVAYMNTEFFDSVLNAGEKTRKPVGAGAYKVKEGNDRIYLNEQAQYERNTYFHTMGSGIENAKIKLLTYQKTNDDMLVSTLKTKTSLDYGAPNCTPDNIKELNGSGLEQIQYDTNGFGYVGINPKFVSDIRIRRAIMMAMNVPSIVTNYYTVDYAKVIYRPISTTSWVYTRTTSAADKEQYFSEYYPYVSGDTSKIEELVRQAGYTSKNGDGVLTNGTDTLKFTFTIAGETEDHPAYDMFTQAAALLNSIGFDITVQTNIQALSLLAQGKLAIWAAAWSSGIDPDMYQVYHMDSKASSVKNWGYDAILAEPQKYATEYQLITELSALIDEGRSVVDEESRTGIYREAMNKVMELAVELPTYQRNDLVVYNGDVIDGNSLNRKANSNAGVLNRIWELDFN